MHVEACRAWRSLEASSAALEPWLGPDPRASFHVPSSRRLRGDTRRRAKPDGRPWGNPCRTVGWSGGRKRASPCQVPLALSRVARYLAAVPCTLDGACAQGRAGPRASGHGSPAESESGTTPGTPSSCVAINADCSWRLVTMQWAPGISPSASATAGGMEKRGASARKPLSFPRRDPPKDPCLVLKYLPRPDTAHVSIDTCIYAYMQPRAELQSRPASVAAKPSSPSQAPSTTESRNGKLNDTTPCATLPQHPPAQILMRPCLFRTAKRPPPDLISHSD